MSKRNYANMSRDDIILSMARDEFSNDELTIDDIHWHTGNMSEGNMIYLAWADGALGGVWIGLVADRDGDSQ